MRVLKYFTLHQWLNYDTFQVLFYERGRAFELLYENRIFMITTGDFQVIKLFKIMYNT